MNREDDGLNAARGILYGIILSIPIWAVIALALGYFITR
jgi:hypothetical protein